MTSEAYRTSSAQADHPSASGRSVLVTGGNRGIGLAIARAFLSVGDAVTVTSRSGNPIDRLRVVACDVTDTTEVDRAFDDTEKAQGPVEVLVANAAVTADKMLVSMSDDEFYDPINTNLMGAFRVTRRAMRSMLRIRKGRIVLISSTAGIQGSTGQANYAASKAGLIGLARSLVREVGSRDITVNVVMPGLVATDMTAVLTESRKAQVVRAVPLGRFATPDEIAQVVTFLTTPGAAYITGAVIPVDGGLVMGY